MNEEKYKKKALFKAEFSMGQLDYERFHEILKAMDDWGIRLRALDSNALIPFYAILKELYVNMKPILFDSIRKKFDKDFENLQEIVYNEANNVKNHFLQGRIVQPDLKVIEKLEDMQMKLLEIRQIIGMGIQVYKIESMQKKLERALGVSHD